MTTRITIPDLCLVLLVGTSGSGKSTFAKRHFKDTEVISSDRCRALISDDENDQSVTSDAFDVLHYIASKRLELGRLTVIDATNVHFESRHSLIKLASKYHLPTIAIVLDPPLDIIIDRHSKRSDRSFGIDVIENHHQQLHQFLKNLRKTESIDQTYVFKSAEDLDHLKIERQPARVNKKNEKGPFDIIGDIHGCFDETIKLIKKLGYQVEKEEFYKVTHPQGRRLIFVGDLVDRGPNSPEVLRLVMDTVSSGVAFCVNGNHDDKLRRKLMGRDVTVANGLQETLDQMEHESDEFKEKVLQFLNERISHYLLDDGKLAVAHAGLKEHYIGRDSDRIHKFCMYGATTGETDEFGFPIRHPWAHEYNGNAMIVYGHTPIPEPKWVNNTINVDTGCVFGGKLTALRYPEKELVSVDAAKVYYKPKKPLGS